MSLTNGCGAVAGVLAPIFVGMMTPNVKLITFFTTKHVL